MAVAPKQSNKEAEMRKERPHGLNLYGISHRSVLTNDMENRPWPFLPSLRTNFEVETRKLSLLC